jgi:PKD repeat protein
VVLLGGILGVAAASFMALPLGLTSGASVAFASGLGLGPTMLANNAPALLFPKPTTGSTPPKANGVFALDYAMGDPITFTEDLSRAPSAPDPTTVTWTWLFGDGATAKGTFTPTHTYTKPGTYIVHAQIPDSKAKLTDVDTAQIHVVASLPANPPVARATISTAYVAAGTEVTLDASASTSADGSALTYAWNFNDGQTATEAHVSHRFAMAGKGFVSLTVTDAHGAKGTTSIDIIAPQQQLSANATTIAPGKSITFTVAADATPSTPATGGQDGQEASYTWSFGDDSQDVTSSQPTVSHTFAKAGHYVVTMQELDGLAPNQTSGPFEALVVTVAVPPPPPWRYAVGAAAVGLGVLISLAAAVRSERRKVALAEQRKAARSQRAGAYGYDDYDDDYRDDYRGSSGGRRGTQRDSRRGGSSRRSRDDRW